MTAQLRLLILTEQIVECKQYGNPINLLPVKTEDGSLSIELKLQSCAPNRFSSTSSYCGRGGKAGDFGHFGHFGIHLTISKCPCPVMVHYSILGLDGNKLAEKMALLQTAGERLSEFVKKNSDKVIVRISVHAVLSSFLAPKSKGARLIFNRARLEGSFCDVNLVVEGVDLPAHRMVLAGRSPVLASMLTGKSEGSVEVADFTKRAVEKFLEFLYTDQVENWEACEVELLQLAAEYAVPELTTECTLRLWGCEGVEALKLLHAAGLSEVLGRPLRRRLTAVVLAAMQTVGLANTKEWKEFEAAYPVLAHTMTPLEQVGSTPSAPQTRGGGQAAGVIRSLNRARLDGYHCDVKLVVEGAELPAHRVVLGARSPVLDKMLTGSYKESLEGRVEIMDFSREAVEKFLEYLYTDQIGHCDVELLQLADKYMVPELQVDCNQKIWDCSPLQAVKLLHAAGLSAVFSCQGRRKLSKTVFDNLNNLVGTEEWEEFQTVNSVVADTILGFSVKEKAFCFMTV